MKFPVSSWEFYQYLYCEINQQKHINKIYFLMYYSPTCFVLFCDLRQFVAQEHKQFQKLYS
jgi:hypothetical protein